MTESFIAGAQVMISVFSFGNGATVDPSPNCVAKAETSGGRAEVIKGVLEKMEQQMKGDTMKATLGDYIRLVQLHKELDEESPKEIKVTWVEPKSGSEE